MRCCWRRSQGQRATAEPLARPEPPAAPRCSTPALALTSAAGHEGGDAGGRRVALSAYGVLRLSFEAVDDSDATAALAPAACIAGGGGGGGGGGASVPVANTTCLAAGGGGGGGCSAVAFEVALAGRPADAGRNRTVCASVTNDQVGFPLPPPSSQSAGCPSAGRSALVRQVPWSQPLP